MGFVGRAIFAFLLLMRISVYGNPVNNNKIEFSSLWIRLDPENPSETVDEVMERFWQGIFFNASEVTTTPIPVVIPEVTTTPVPDVGTQSHIACGSTDYVAPKVVGGLDANPEQFPWMVALMEKKRDILICGGSLITEKHVITAAHCLEKYTKDDLDVRLGEYNFSTPEDHIRDISVLDIKRHEKYNDPIQYEHDMAILTLSTSITFDKYIRPICVQSNFRNLTGIYAHAIGWGQTQLHGPTSDVLQEVRVPIWNSRECEKAYAGLTEIASTMMCAGGLEGGRDTCQGDSGGPLMILDIYTHIWTLVGVISFGDRCGVKGKPGIYGQIIAESRWIDHWTRNRKYDNL